jgi:hypothetical protein
MPKKQPLYPHIPKSKLGAFTCGQCGQPFHLMEDRNKHLARYHPEANSSITRLAMTSTGKSFPLGRLMITRGVNDLVADNKEFALFVLNSLQRHAKGDWGDLSEEDKKENEYSLRRRLRLFSVYERPPLPKIWIITEADRSLTTVLFPEEY